tara:strand:- start:141 stop:473 length:333 start_codon:yes stop_codon:yes gene_type:complete
MSLRIQYLETRDEFKILLSCAEKILVRAYADWCEPCKKIHDLFEDESNKLSDDGIYIVNINVDSGYDLASFLKIKSVPQFRYYKNGELLEISTSGNKVKFLKFIEKIKKL